MSKARLREVRLTAFKSFRDEVLPLDEITVLTGLNSSGKSNALDGLEVLSRLAVGDTLTETLDSRSGYEGPIRGLTGLRASRNKQVQPRVHSRVGGQHLRVRGDHFCQTRTPDRA